MQKKEVELGDSDKNRMKNKSTKNKGKFDIVEELKTIGFEQVILFPEKKLSVVVKTQKDTLEQGAVTYEARPRYVYFYEVAEEETQQEIQKTLGMLQQFKEDREIQDEEIMGIFVGEHSKAGMAYSRKYANAWYIDLEDKCIYRYEHQREDFGGIRSHLEKCVREGNSVLPSRVVRERIATLSKPSVLMLLMLIGAMVMTIIGFLTQGESDLFALNYQVIREPNQWYRLLSYPFASNNFWFLLLDLLLIVVGFRRVEPYYKKFTILLGYVICGICGGIFSMCFSIFTMSDCYLKGSSTSVSGFLGMLVFYYLYHGVAIPTRDYFHTLKVWLLLMLSVEINVGGNYIAALSAFVCGIVYSMVVTWFRELFLAIKRKSSFKDIRKQNNPDA